MKELYSQIHSALKKDLGVTNDFAVPRITKVNLSVGIGSYIRKGGDKNFEQILENITALTGQKPVVTKARMAVSNFKLRIGDPVGVIVTLRGPKMNDFLTRLVGVTLPRIRDFRGISSSGFDGHGNYTLGIKEVTVFPEVNPDNIGRNHGLQITINTTAKDDLSAYKLFKALGFPFKDEPKVKSS